MKVPVPSTEIARQVAGKVVDWGVDGLGPMSSAVDVAEEHLQHCGGDPERAVQRVIATHRRIVAASGFATGLGGFITLPITVPTDLTVLYAYSARCTAAIAHLRGYDVDTEEVRSLVLITLLGSGGAAVLSEAGVQVAQKGALAALRKLPGKTLIEINKKVGFRLVTKFGEKGVVNLHKLVPLAGGPVGAGVNVATIRTVATYAKRNFPAVPA
jgi:hypothetical protein